MILFYRLNYHRDGVDVTIHPEYCQLHRYPHCQLPICSLGIALSYRSLLVLLNKIFHVFDHAAYEQLVHTTINPDRTYSI